MSEVKNIRISSGEDIVATILERGDDYLSIENPIVAVPTTQGKVGFAPWAPFVDKTEKTIKVNLNFVVFEAEPDNDIVTQYKSMYGGVLTPNKQNIIL